MYKLLFNYTVLIIVALSCKHGVHKASKASSIVYDQIALSIPRQGSRAYDISDSKGVIVARVGNDLSKRLSIYDQSGNIWSTFSFKGGLKRDLSEIQPLAKDTDIHLLAFNCVGITDKCYRVIVNENSKEVKYIKIGDRAFQLKTWPEYILTCFSIDFDFTDNPLKTKPFGKGKEIFYSKDGIYHPVKFQDDWLQLKWGDETNWHYGWVRWRKNNALILELFNNG